MPTANGILACAVGTLVAWSLVHDAAACHTAALEGEPAKLPAVYTTWQTFTTQDGLPHNTIRAIRIFGDRVWVGTDGGLAVWDGDTWKRWTTDDGLPWPMIRAIDVDPKTEDVWLGTWGRGLVRFTGGRFDRFDQRTSGMAANLIFAVLVDDDRVWAATNSGISCFDVFSKEWSLHLERRGDAPEHVVTALQKAGDDLYAHLWCGPSWRLDLASGEWTSVELPAVQGADSSMPTHPFDDLTLQTTLVDGFLWQATPTRLLRRDRAGRWEARRLGHPGITGEFVHCVAARAEGAEAWLGTDQGLKVLADWDSDSWVTYRCDEGDSGCVVTAFAGGRMVDSRLLAPGIPDNRVRCMAFDGDRVWVGTVNGLALGVGRGRWGDLRAAGSVSRSGVGGKGIGGGEAASASSSAGDSDGSAALKAVVIAGLGPKSRMMVLPGADLSKGPCSNRPNLLAVQLAIDEVNARGGYRGRVPFVLTTGPLGYADYGWVTAEDDFPQYASKRDVMGIVGQLRPNTLIASAAAFHSEVPVINIAAQPPTVDEIINPWMFRCQGDRPRQYRLILDHITGALGARRVALLRTPESLRQTPLDIVTAYLRDRESSGLSLAADLICNPSAGDCDRALERIVRAGADAVLTWCDAPTSARIVRRMREMGMTQLFVGSDRIVGPEFVERAGDAPGRVIAFHPSTSYRNRVAARLGEEFARRFKLRAGPDAYRSYRGAKHLLEAINAAGLDRRAIRRTLERMSRDTGGENACLGASSPRFDTILAELDGGTWRFRILKGP